MHDPGPTISHSSSVGLSGSQSLPSYRTLNISRVEMLIPLPGSICFPHFSIFIHCSFPTQPYLFITEDLLQVPFLQPFQTFPFSSPRYTHAQLLQSCEFMDCWPGLCPCEIFQARIFGVDCHALLQPYRCSQWLFSISWLLPREKYSSLAIYMLWQPAGCRCRAWCPGRKEWKLSTHRKYKGLLQCLTTWVLSLSRKENLLHNLLALSQYSFLKKEFYWGVIYMPFIQSF